ncbi:long-chain-acyl-CoA synthetase [Acinetobacter sp. A3.8]|uniref:Long-chain-acyl-CoA synthetase n=1 Tax=Acinetobacter sedimenti TaxID=2919922 RepID=A0A9X1WUY6_9GAMM|nr:long-chain-acyl-CoA synthetase [Acinetobacter sedimenti]MCJ8145709.1 long-chain-acyl-CoA synthetase [Acinetobacter sedimenti]
MSHDATKDIISLSDVIKQVPQFAKKLPNVLNGLRHAYLRRPSSACGLGWAFEKAVEENPTGTALLYEDQKFSYTELNAWANQIADYFLKQGAKKGDVIAVMIENRPELVVTVLGLAKIGVVTALVNTSQCSKVLSHSINLVKPFAVVIGEEVQQAVLDVQNDLELAKDKYYWFADDAFKTTAPKPFVDLAQAIQTCKKHNPSTTNQVCGKDGLFYIYTSGTTGLPKAVIFKHSRWMLAYGTYGHVLDLDQDDVMYATLPLYHATGMVVCWCGVIAGASTLAIRRKFSKSNFWKDVQKFDASAIGYVGELCRYLLDCEPTPEERNHRVRKMIGNGMRSNIWHEFKERFNVDEVLELYASSEGNVGFSNIFNFENTVGFSPTPYAIIAFDKEKNEPIRGADGFCQKVKKGESGLLIGKITSRSPFDGYTDPEKNKSVIMENVLKSGDKFFNTGDLVRDIGFRHAQFVDRLGDTFRWKGENVSTTQVENIVSDYEKISEAVVYGVEIPNTNGRAGMAAITLQEGKSLDENDLKNMVNAFKAELPAYAVPVFLRIQKQIETTGTFKYSKNKLKEQAFDPEKCQEQIFVLLPSDAAYSEVDATVFKQINQGKYRF